MKICFLDIRLNILNEYVDKFVVDGNLNYKKIFKNKKQEFI